MKDYYKILRVPRIAGQDEIKRSYRRLASQYHPDVNPDKNAHQMLVEINQAYEVLSSPNSRQLYDQQLYYIEHQLASGGQYGVQVVRPVDKRYSRRGKKETPQEREARFSFIRFQNTGFNGKMRIVSFVTLFFAFTIFLDHYLPVHESFKKIGYNFHPRATLHDPERVLSVYTTDGMRYALLPAEVAEEMVGLRSSEGLFSQTPIWGVLVSVRIVNVIFVPDKSNYHFMLLYGLVCISSLVVIFFKKEKNIYIPATFAFFNGILILTFWIILLTNS